MGIKEIHPVLLEARDLLDGSGIQWAVCGGFALDLFLGRPTRVHGDLDLAVPEEDRARIERFMQGEGWHVYEFRGQGRLRRLHRDTRSETGRNLMCVREGCGLVTFWPCDEPGMVLHSWHSEGIQELNYMEFLFHERADGMLLAGHDVRAGLDRAILQRDGVPFFAPELVLLLKAAQPDRAANLADFEAAFPALEAERRGWFLRALRSLYPAGHPWEEGGDFHG